MEEIVRAFNYVIEKGWVGSIYSVIIIFDRSILSGSLLGHVGMGCEGDRRSPS